MKNGLGRGMDKFKYLAIVVERGITACIEPFETYEEAKTFLLEVAGVLDDAGVDLRDINEGENHYSIWEWTENAEYEEVV